MTKKEVIKILKRQADGYYLKTTEALIIAIKALEQEPCEDAISRQAVKDMLDARGVKAVITFEHFKELLDKLPSVTPQPKTGHWIPVSERLPKEYEKVIVSDVFGVYIGQFVDAEENWGGKHFINEHGMHSKSVIAWMPLPDPYKAEGSES